mmetsp:Transcript_316/g.582  ORF Transcript_316/g.582 Transcript_316/m.582 type:complete len:249 (+) Transcript_316:1349-2095(+)
MIPTRMLLSAPTSISTSSPLFSVPLLPVVVDNSCSVSINHGTIFLLAIMDKLFTAMRTPWAKAPSPPQNSWPTKARAATMTQPSPTPKMNAPSNPNGMLCISSRPKPYTTIPKRVTPKNAQYALDCEAFWLVCNAVPEGAVVMPRKLVTISCWFPSSSSSLSLSSSSVSSSSLLVPLLLLASLSSPSSSSLLLQQLLSLSSVVLVRDGVGDSDTDDRLASTRLRAAIASDFPKLRANRQDRRLDATAF